MQSRASAFVAVLLAMFSLELLLGTPCRAQASTAPSSTQELALQQELVRLTLQRDLLREANRRWVPPALVLGVGAASMVVGGIVFAMAWRSDYSCSGGDGHYSCDDDYNQAMDRAGLVMMPTGAALVLTATPLLIARAIRARRLRRAERAIELLQQRRLSLAPRLGAEQRGLSVRLAF